MQVHIWHQGSQGIALFGVSYALVIEIFEFSFLSKYYKIPHIFTFFISLNTQK